MTFALYVVWKQRFLIRTISIHENVVQLFNNSGEYYRTKTMAEY